MMRSLRARLLVGSLASTLAVFLAAAALLYWMVRNSLLTEFDAALDATAHALASMVEQGPRGITLDLDPGQMPEFGRSRHADYFLIRDEQGLPVARSASLQGLQWSVAAPADPRHPTHAWVHLSRDRRGRVVQFTFVPRAEDEDRAISPRPLLITVARDATELRRRLLELTWLLAGAFGVALLLSVATSAWVVGRGLRPLGVLADRIEAIGARDLSERIRMDQVPLEMRGVVQRLNELLAKVEVSLQRERAFTADVAHELRTPLAGLTTAIEVCLSQRRSPEDYDLALRRCLVVCGSMRCMVENLLALARADAGQVRPVPEPIDLAVLLQQQWTPFEGEARQRRLEVAWSTSPLVVAVDRGLLATVLRNLFDNAVTYCNAGGRITIETRPLPGGGLLRISNTGSQVDATDAHLVFERFWRGDAVRAAGGHCGLGLALCREILTLLHGSIRVETAAGGSFTVQLEVLANPSGGGTITPKGTSG